MENFFFEEQGPTITETPIEMPQQHIFEHNDNNQANYTFPQQIQNT
jgi:hypothetical protein